MTQSAVHSCSMKASHDALGFTQPATWRGEECDTGTREEQFWEEERCLLILFFGSEESKEFKESHMFLRRWWRPKQS